MSSFFSKIDEIAKLRFEPFPTKPIDGMRVIRIDRTLIGVKNDFHGRPVIYSTQVAAGCHYLGSASCETTFNGCKRLGILSTKVVKAHMDEAKRAAKLRSEKYSAESLLIALKDLGLKTSITQQREIDAVMKRAKK